MTELTARDLMTRTDLTTRTGGYASVGDGGGLEWRLTREEPKGRVDRRLALPTADGGWATPTNLPALSTLTPQPRYVVNDTLARARTYMDDPDNRLIWEGSGRPGPLYGGYPAVWGRPPYPITCSHLVGMIMCGWEMGTTVYSDGVKANSPTGWIATGLANPPESTGVWWAQRLAKWCFSKGYLARANEVPLEGLERGDILFFSRRNPENSYDRVRAGSLEPYFANVYHVSIYLGGGRTIHSTGPTTPKAVYEGPLGESLSNDLTLVARPLWRLPH